MYAIGKIWFERKSQSENSNFNFFWLSIRLNINQIRTLRKELNSIPFESEVYII